MANTFGPLNLKQNINFDEPLGMTNTLKLLRDLQFGTVNWVKHINGVFTPADQLENILAVELGPTETVTYMMLLVEGGFLNVAEVNRNDDWGAYYGVQDIMIKKMPPSTGTERLKNLILDGRVAAQNPMPQGEPVEYCLILANISEPA